MVEVYVVVDDGEPRKTLVSLMDRSIKTYEMNIGKKVADAERLQVDVSRR